MALTDQDRIREQRMHPRIVDLWFALQPLKSVVTFMNTGAHPDDETSAMLAALGFRDGLGLSFACANRGEGGQNDIGTETGADLGALRTREMERAATVLDMRLYWLSQSADDTIYDFGFSKSGEETLAKWGHSRTLARFVEIIRTERPDIICPTFLDVPGQHGHHRAMTQAAHEVMTSAADPDFACDLPVWQVKKLYLPAWGGGGGSYDDEVPPPPATLIIEAKGTDPVTGWTYEQIGQHSRAYHKTQGMGRWWPVGEERDWPLHLAESHVDGPDETIFSGLPKTLRDLGLIEAQDAIDAAIANFPNVATEAARAFAILNAIKPNTIPDDHAHRITRKLQELSRVIRLASGTRVRAELEPSVIRQGTPGGLTLEISSDAPSNTIRWPDHWKVVAGHLQAGPEAETCDAYRAEFDPFRPQKPYVSSDIEVAGQTISAQTPFAQEPLVIPENSAEMAPDKAIINRQTDIRQISLSIINLHPLDAELGLDLPTGWTAERHDTDFLLNAPKTLENGLVTIPLTLNGKPAQSVRKIDYPHINPTIRITPTDIKIRVLNVKVPQTKVGYIGENDRVDHWLTALGADVTRLSEKDWNPTRLAEFDTIIIGIFAFRFVKGLTHAIPNLHDWTNAGGNLVTLYHRPWDNWDPKNTPPKPLEIGQPSLRWRVTDENADVTHLSANHPILTSPNKITDQDWKGWHKERGLYFAKSWDPVYEPLLEMADPKEAPHRGAMITAKIGKGRHTHTSLILHHQMEMLTPGAFKIMANLLGNAL